MPPKLQPLPELLPEELRPTGHPHQQRRRQCRRRRRLQALHRRVSITCPRRKSARTFETNLFGAVAVACGTLPLLKASPRGRIVNRASILGSLTLHSDPKSPIYRTKPLGNYDASKAALSIFTIHLAYGLKDTRGKGQLGTSWLGEEELAWSGRRPHGSARRRQNRGVARHAARGGARASGFFHDGKPLPW